MVDVIKSSSQSPKATIGEFLKRKVRFAILFNVHNEHAMFSNSMQLAQRGRGEMFFLVLTQRGGGGEMSFLL